MFKLVIQDDEGKTTVVPLIRDEITIGRKEGNTIRLTERNVSRRHARIVRANGAVAIEDLGSYNGVRVNGTRIAQRTSLSISDRVQIGDYLIELKAEGAETVTDEGKTQPIERMDPTFIEAQIGSLSGAPPGLMAPGSAAIHALADTDPTARSVASGAMPPAAMGMATANGRLVVLSSNFAGQEWELVRPQMIIGRTDDNDMVVNHRSISRNHAKVVREPDTGRYTISDLQSSNGVRVNGEEYGKVELRRGDIVDLGHVRLRFIEPGEDFVFGRDAQIADVPLGTKNKGLMIAAAVGLLGIGVIAFVMLSRDKQTKMPVVIAQQDARTVVAGVPAKADAATVAMNPPIDVNKTLAECKAQRDVDNPDWMAIKSCAEQAGCGTQACTDLAAQAKREAANKIRYADLEKAVVQKDHQAVQQHLKTIDKDSIYYERAVAPADQLKADFIDDELAKGRRLVANKDCRTLRTRTDQVGKIYPDAEAALRTLTCRTETADVRPPPRPECRNDGDCGGDKACKGGKCVSAPGPACDKDALLKEARAAGGASQWSKMYQKADASIRCESSRAGRQLALLAACRLGDKGKAMKYWKEFETQMRQTCIGVIP